VTNATVIYDGDCGFCKWCLAVLLRMATLGALRPLPLGTAEADRLLADLSVEERQASWHLVVDAPTPSAPESLTRPLRLSAGAALAPVMEFVRGGQIPAVVFRRFPRATERGYRWVVDNRGLLGRFVPERARRWADRVIAAQREVPQ
jgi:predicted DCC family thiol-disulfide oxidoreductase YuxK